MQRGSPVDVFQNAVGVLCGEAFFLAGTEPGKAECVLLFFPGKSLEKFMIGEGAEFFRPHLDFVQTGGGKDYRLAFGVAEPFQPVKVCQGDAVASIEMLQ